MIDTTRITACLFRFVRFHQRWDDTIPNIDAVDMALLGAALPDMPWQELGRCIAERGAGTGRGFWDQWSCLLMWVRQFNKPSPSHHHFYRWYQPFPNGWFMTLFYTHYWKTIDSIHVFHAWKTMNLIPLLLFSPFGSQFGGGFWSSQTHFLLRGVMIWMVLSTYVAAKGSQFVRRIKVG